VVWHEQLNEYIAAQVYEIKGKQGWKIPCWYSHTWRTDESEFKMSHHA